MKTKAMPLTPKQPTPKKAQEEMLNAQTNIIIIIQNTIQNNNIKNNNNKLNNKLNK